MANVQTSGNCMTDRLFMTVHDGFVVVRNLRPEADLPPCWHLSVARYDRKDFRQLTLLVDEQSGFSVDAL